MGVSRVVNSVELKVEYGPIPVKIVERGWWRRPYVELQFPEAPAVRLHSGDTFTMDIPVRITGDDAPGVQSVRDEVEALTEAFMASERRRGS